MGPVKVLIVLLTLLFSTSSSFAEDKASYITSWRCQGSNNGGVAVIEMQTRPDHWEQNNPRYIAPITLKVNLGSLADYETLTYQFPAEKPRVPSQEAAVATIRKKTGDAYVKLAPNISSNGFEATISFSAVRDQLVIYEFSKSRELTFSKCEEKTIQL